MLQKTLISALLLLPTVGCKLSSSHSKTADNGPPPADLYIQPTLSGTSKISITALATNPANYPDLQSYAAQGQHFDDLLTGIAAAFVPGSSSRAAIYTPVDKEEDADYTVIIKNAEVELLICPALLGDISTACANYTAADQVIDKLKVNITVKGHGQPPVGEAAADSSGFVVMPRLTMSATSISGIKVHGGIIEDGSLTKALVIALDNALIDVKINGYQPFNPRTHGTKASAPVNTTGGDQVPPTVVANSTAISNASGSGSSSVPGGSGTD